MRSFHACIPGFFFSVSFFFIGSTPATAVGAALGDSATLREAKTGLTRLVEKQKAAKNFFLNFESTATGPDGSPLPKSEGSLWAADSGRFRLEHSQGVVVCDGHTLWQYFPKNKQVIVNSAGPDSSGTAAGVLLRFLSAKPVRAEKTGAGLRLILDPVSVGENLDSLILILDAKASAVRGLETQDPVGARVAYRVKALRYGAGQPRGGFSFTAPKGVEVVDMR